MDHTLHPTGLKHLTYGACLELESLLNEGKICRPKSSHTLTHPIQSVMDSIMGLDMGLPFPVV